LLFRWEPAAPPPAGRRGLWLLPLLALWLALAAVAQQRQRSVPAAPDTAPAGQVADFLAPAASDATSAVVAAPAPAALPATAPKASRPQAGLRPRPVPTAPATTEAPAALALPAEPPLDLDRIAFERLPSDAGLVAPIAAEPPDEALASALARIRRQLERWPPATAGPPEQQVRTLLLIAAVPDLLQMDPLERHLPLLVETELKQRFAADALARLLFEAALHPAAGSVAARSELPAIGLPAHAGPEAPLRGRVMLYAFKLLGRITGRRVGDPPLPDQRE